MEGKIKFLIEVKAAGVGLNETHLRQIVNYGANQGIEWIVLTNAVEWRVYKITFGQPISHEEVTRFHLPDISPKREEDLQKLFLLAREGLTADAISSFHQQVQQFNRYTVAQIITSDTITTSIRKELRRIFPDLKIEVSQIQSLIINEVIKRDTLEDEQVKEAQQRIKKAIQKLNRNLNKDKAITTQDMVAIVKEEALPEVTT